MDVIHSVCAKSCPVLTGAGGYREYTYRAHDECHDKGSDEKISRVPEEHNLEGARSREECRNLHHKIDQGDKCPCISITTMYKSDGFTPDPNDGARPCTALAAPEIPVARNHEFPTFRPD